MRSVLCVAPAIFLLAGCHTNSGATTDSTDLEREHLQQEQQKIDQTNRKNCADIAQGILDRTKAENPNSIISGSNHYNRQQSQCFMRLNILDVQGGTSSESEELLDAYENKVVLSCATTDTTPKYCFIPGNSSPTGKPLRLTLPDAAARIAEDLNN